MVFSLGGKTLSTSDKPTNDLLEWVLCKEIQDEGASAAKQGISRYKNPYKYGTKHYEWWLEGFDKPQDVYCNPFQKKKVF